MPDVGTEYPVSCRLDLGETIDVGMTPIGHRLIGPITGARWRDRRCREQCGRTVGLALPARRRALELDVRATLRARDGSLIYMPYTAWR